MLQPGDWDQKDERWWSENCRIEHAQDGARGWEFEQSISSECPSACRVGSLQRGQWGISNHACLRMRHRAPDVTQQEWRAIYNADSAIKGAPVGPGGGRPDDVCVTVRHPGVGNRSLIVWYTGGILQGRGAPMYTPRAYIHCNSTSNGTHA